MHACISMHVHVCSCIIVISYVNNLARDTYKLWHIYKVSVLNQACTLVFQFTCIRVCSCITVIVYIESRIILCSLYDVLIMWTKCNVPTVTVVTLFICTYDIVIRYNRYSHSIWTMLSIVPLLDISHGFLKYIILYWIECRNRFTISRYYLRIFPTCLFFNGRKEIRVMIGSLCLK